MGKKHYECQFCEYIPSMERCWRCRKTSKWEMAEVIQGMTRVYITEDNAYRGGRGKIKYTNEELEHILKMYGELGTVRKVAEKMGLNKDKVQRMLKIARERRGDADHE